MNTFMLMNKSDGEIIRIDRALFYGFNTYIKKGLGFIIDPSMAPYLERLHKKGYKLKGYDVGTTYMNHLIHFEVPIDTKYLMGFSIIRYAPPVNEDDVVDVIGFPGYSDEDTITTHKLYIEYLGELDRFIDALPKRK